MSGVSSSKAHVLVYASITKFKSVSLLSGPFRHCLYLSFIMYIHAFLANYFSEIIEISEWNDRSSLAAQRFNLGSVRMTYFSVKWTNQSSSAVSCDQRVIWNVKMLYGQQFTRTLLPTPLYIRAKSRIIRQITFLHFLYVDILQCYSDIHNPHAIYSRS